MSRREKCTYEEKIKAVEDYLNGVRSQKQIAVDLGLGKRGRSTVGRWVRRYQTAGPDALLPSIHNNTYSKEFKEQVVQEYLEGKGSSDELAIKYGIPNHSTVLDWISIYNDLKEQKATPKASEVYIAKSTRKISEDDSMEDMQYSIKHALNDTG